MKANQFITFKNDEVGEIKGFIKNNEPWFLVGNVCRCLGIKNSREALRKIKEKRRNAGIEGVISSDILVETEGGRQKASIIPERILYELIFQSRKKKAYLFQTWVYDVVLPSLREHGEYRMAGKLIHRTMTDSLKDSGEVERMHGHAYSTYQKLINKTLGLPDKTNKDILPGEILEKIAHRENLVKSLLDEGMEYSRIKSILTGM